MSLMVDLDRAARGADPEAGLRAVARLRSLVEQLEAAQVAAARRRVAPSSPSMVRPLR